MALRTEHKEYYGTKCIHAWPEANGMNGVEGYCIQYGDDYTSWSPKGVFEASYRSSGHLKFGHAMVACQDHGRKIARQGWNGKGMFVYYVQPNSYPAQTDAAREHFGEMVPYGGYFAMKTAQDNVVPWLASQSDMSADDWCLV